MKIIRAYRSGTVTKCAVAHYIIVHVLAVIGLLAITLIVCVDFLGGMNRY